MRKENEKEGGTLTIDVQRIINTGSLEYIHPDLKSIRVCATVIIADTGVGMTRETMKNIFDPFYTTKEKGEGTGLGLAMSYKTIHDLGGAIHVYSEPGHGTIFTVYLEALDDDSIVSEDTSLDNIIKGTGTILIVDDESHMLHVSSGILQECGYAVIIAGGVDDALKIYSAESDSVDLVIVDYGMPSMSGIELFNEFKKINPAVKAILTSGMLSAGIKIKAVELGISHFIKKPYTPEDLSRIVKSIITEQ